MVNKKEAKQYVKNSFKNSKKRDRSAFEYRDKVVKCLKQAKTPEEIDDTLFNIALTQLMTCAYLHECLYKMYD